MLEFTDGVKIDTSGPLRTMELKGGWYVVGGGLLVAVATKADGETMIEQLQAE